MHFPYWFQRLAVALAMTCLALFDYHDGWMLMAVIEGAFALLVWLHLIFVRV